MFYSPVRYVLKKHSTSMCQVYCKRSSGARIKLILLNSFHYLFQTIILISKYTNMNILQKSTVYFFKIFNNILLYKNVVSTFLSRLEKPNFILFLIFIASDEFFKGNFR